MMAPIAPGRKRPRLPRLPATRLLALATVGAAALCVGCLTLPAATVPACTTDSDCNQAAGEVCDEGICWGNPPDGSFSAIVGPPASASNRVPAEYREFTMPDHGWLGDLVVDLPVTVTGQLTFICTPPTPCGEMEGSSIVVTRPSRIPGAAPFRSVINVEVGPSDTVTYELKLPRTNRELGDEPYQVTVIPNSQSNNIGATPRRAVLPPLRTTLEAAADTRRDFTVGSTTLPTLSGKITDANGVGLPGYRVSARGRWADDAVVSDVSTVVDTDNLGNYRLLLSPDLVGGVEVIAEPITAGAGVLVAKVRTLGQNISNIDIEVPSRLTAPTLVNFTLVGTTGSGEVLPIAGAVVTMSSEIANPRIPTYASGIRLGGTATSNAEGVAKLSLVGFREGTIINYSLQIQPPATSQFRAVFGDRFTVSDAFTRQLEPRIAVRGVVANSYGEPVANVAVTARPNAEYLTTLEPDAQAFAAQLALGTATSDKAGEFVIWVDPPLVTASSYDFSFEPPDDTAAPRWSVAQAVMPTTRITSMNAGPFIVPEAARVHGRITDPTGHPLGGGELRIFRQGQAQVCRNSAATCVSAAILLGRGTADDEGVVRLTLPR